MIVRPSRYRTINTVTTTIARAARPRGAVHDAAAPAPRGQCRGEREQRHGDDTGLDQADVRPEPGSNREVVQLEIVAQIREVVARRPPGDEQRDAEERCETRNDPDE